MEKEGLQNNEYENQYDLPVNKIYIQKIKEFGANIKIRHSSKWLNAVSVSFSESPTNELENTIRRISELSFVSSIDVVDRYKKENAGEDTQRKEEEEEDEINDTKMNKRETTAIDYGSSYTQLELTNTIEAHKQGLNGTGVTVIILDSGFDKSHPSISPLSIIAEYDFLDNDNNTQSIPADAQNVHGTACLSNLGGWAPGFIIGSGFGASFILAKTENTKTETTAEEDTFIAAVEWGESLGADILSASLGYSQWYTFMERNGSISPVSITCDRASKLGMIIVVAAGNAGSSGITTPGDAYEVISVGAVSKGGNVAGFSSLGPSADGRIKPEIAAHGVDNIIATTPDSATPVPLYGKRSGTSFACPIVAGAIAILLQAHPNWTPSMVKEALQMTGSSTNSPNFGVGWGIIDIIAAINYVPVSGDCTTHGCSSQGCCVNSQCQCSPGYYGKYCNFERVECVSFCNMRSGGVGQCLKLPTGMSYRCSDPEYRVTKDFTVIPSCPGCVKDMCGVCFGFNDTCCDTSVDECGVCGGNGLSCGATTTIPTTTTDSSVSSLFPSNFLSCLFIILIFVFTNK